MIARIPADISAAGRSANQDNRQNSGKPFFTGNGELAINSNFS